MNTCFWLDQTNAAYAAKNEAESGFFPCCPSPIPTSQCFFFSPARESIMPMLQLTQDEKPIIWQSFKCPRGQALEGLGKRLGMSTCGLEVESRDVVNDPENDENHEV